MTKELLQLLKTEEEDILKKIEELNNSLEPLYKKLKHIKSLIEIETETQSSRSNTSYNSSEYELPIKYDTSLTQLQKTYVALYQIGDGYFQDIAKELVKIAPNEFDLFKALKVAKQFASKLYSDKRIGALKIGNKNKYFIE